MTLTELSIKRPTFIVVIFSALAALGIFSYTQLKYELLPRITPPFVTVATIYPGASPKEVETSVSKVIEDAVSSVDKVSAVRTTSSEGVSFIGIEFQQSANVDLALQEVQRKVGEVTFRLPSDAKAPTISKFALDEIPVLRMGVTSTMPSKEFYQLLKDHIQPSITKLPGVGQVSLLGGNEREIKVNLDAQKVRSYGLSILQVTNAIKMSNLDFPTGKIKEGDEQFIVRIAGKINSLDELRNLVLAKSKQNGDIKLSDVAEIQDGEKEFTTASRINGKSSVGIFVQKQSDANTVDVSKIVRDELKNIEATYANINLKFDVAQDGSLFTTDAADAVKHDLTLAIFLVALVMLMFLHSVRNSLIVMVAIPASLVSTFIVMYALNYTLNLMTLLAMSLVIGILVDDSIVVLENIYRHIEMGKEKREASLIGRNEIGFSALSITLVDVVVFLPLALVSGLIGNIIRQFSVVVVISTLLSLFVSFTITPMLASRFAKHERLSKKSLMGRFALWFEAMYHKIAANYISVLKWSLHNRGKVALMTIVMFIASFALIPLGFIGSEFISQTDRGEFAVTIELPPGSTIENTNRVSRQVEDMFSEIPEIKKVFTNVGVSNEGLFGQTSNNASELNVTLVPPTERAKSTDDVAAEIKMKVSEIPGVKVRVNPIGIFGTANETPIQLGINGTNIEDVRTAAKQIADAMRNIPGTADVRLSSEEGKPETRVEIDREKIATFGLSLAEVGASLRVALSGNDDSKFRDGENEYDIRIVLDEFDRSKTSDVGNLTFMNSKGQQIELKQFANIYQTTGPTKLQRENRNNSIYIFSQAIGRPSGSIGEDIKKSVATLQLPKDIAVSYLGNLKNQGDAFGSLGLALLAGILFVYMIMVALYDSYVYPFVVLFSIPVAMVGALLALALMMKSLSIFSILGIIMLMGLVGKNAILLVDRTNQMRLEEKLSAYDALLEAGQTRLRPILMTTLSMVIGMLPIAVATSAGTEWKSGLAWAIIGGLLSSMFLTLIVVPGVYITVDRMKEKIPAFFKKPFARWRKNDNVEFMPEVVTINN